MFFFHLFRMYNNILKSFDKQCVLSTARKSWLVKLNIKKYLQQRAKEKIKEEFYRLDYFNVLLFTSYNMQLITYLIHGNFQNVH